MRAGSTPAGAWALGVMGCGDECQPYTGKCEGNTAWRCISPENGTATWGRAQDCGALFCRSSSFGAVCASSKDLDPVCSESLTLPQDGVCAGSYGVDCHMIQEILNDGKLEREHTRHVACETIVVLVTVSISAIILSGFDAIWAFFTNWFLR